MAGAASGSGDFRVMLPRLSGRNWQTCWVKPGMLVQPFRRAVGGETDIVELHVRRRQVGARFREDRHLGGADRQRPGAEQRILRRHARHFPPAHHDVVHGDREPAAIGQAGLEMILQVAADARQIVQHRKAHRLQRRRRPHARQQQQLRRVDRAAAQNHLAARPHGYLFPGPADHHAHRAAPLEQHAFGVRVGQHAQIGRRIAGFRNATAAEQRRPLRDVVWKYAVPSCIRPL